MLLHKLPAMSQRPHDMAMTSVWHLCNVKCLLKVLVSKSYHGRCRGTHVFTAIRSMLFSRVIAAPPRVKGSWVERPLIFRDLRSTGHFLGTGEQFFFIFGELGTTDKNKISEMFWLLKGLRPKTPPPKEKKLP